MKEGIEVTENHLKNILNNKTYKKLNTFDFSEYDALLRDRKRKTFSSETEFLAYKREMLSGIKKGDYDKPTIQINNNGFAKCIDGFCRLLTCKVLGIDAVVNIVLSEAAPVMIVNQRLHFKK